VQRKFKTLLADMKQRKDVLKLLFDREFMSMKLYFTTMARKNKKSVPQAKLFEPPVDIEIRDYLIEEFFNNVCRRFCKLNL
jgi:hypothetical protein